MLHPPQGEAGGGVPEGACIPSKPLGRSPPPGGGVTGGCEFFSKTLGFAMAEPGKGLAMGVTQGKRPPWALGFLKTNHPPSGEAQGGCNC